MDSSNGKSGRGLEDVDDTIPPSSSSTPVNHALSGASHAFGKPIIKPKPKPPALQQQNNGALSAATSSWKAHSNQTSPEKTEEPNPPTLPRRTNILPPPAITTPSQPVPKRPFIAPPPEKRPTSLPPRPPPTTSVKPELRKLPSEMDAMPENPAPSKPQPPPPRRTTGRTDSALGAHHRTHEQLSVNLAGLQVGSKPSARELSPGRTFSRANTILPPPRRLERIPQSKNRISPHMTGDNLADAIVGASLAASRTPPSEPSSAPISRGRSPVKAGTSLRQTLRSPEQPESTSENERHNFRHPNKYNEGDRKRWRDKVSEEEYKQWAGMWSANKGYLLSSREIPIDHRPSNIDPDGTLVNLDDELCNIVVRELWSRSKLHTSVLKQIWDLVDSRGVCRLTKDQFIVGMWLIERQREGRKLPVKVPQSVWESVRAHGGTGVKIRVRD